jgi:ketosteroid isomerase-like protein
MEGSAPNLDLIRRVYELGRRYLEGDRQPLKSAVADLFAPDVEVVPSSALASGTVGPYKGHDGIRRWMADIGQTWDQFETRDEHWLEVPPDRVVVLGTIVAGRPAQHGYAVKVGWIWTVSDGRVIGMHSYETYARALDEAGVPEEISDSLHGAPEDT